MRKIAAILLITAMLLGLMSGCDRSGETATVWLLASVRSGRSVESVEVPVPEGEDPGETAIRALIDPPEQAAASGLASPFVEGVELESITYYGGVAAVHLSEEYLSMSGYRLAEAEGCIVLTMLEIDRVIGVSILVNGQYHPESAQDFMSATDIAFETPGAASLERELTLYFRSDSTGRLAAEQRGIVMPEGEPVEHYIIEELIKGPTQSGLSPVLPDTLELLDVESVGTACLLDFSQSFSKVTGASRSEELFALMAIVNSLAASSSIDTVYFTENGEPLYGGAALGEVRSENDPANYASFEVWLPSNDGEYVEPARVRLNVSGAYTRDRLLVEYLISGVDGAGFDSVLPPETRVESITSTQTSCVIEFAEGFEQSMSRGGYDLDLVMAALAHTLSANGYGSYGVEVRVGGARYAFATADNADVHPDFRE